MGKNEAAWRALFADLGVLAAIESDGAFIIASDAINRYRESRLMTKFDHRANLPEIFRDNGLAILPVTRGSYVIGRFEAYAAQPYAKGLEPVAYALPANLESLDPAALFSEAAAINCAFVSGMIDGIAGGRTVQTVSGKMGTSKFDFRIRSGTGESRRISVENSQCEIDGGFESPEALVLIEAKNAVSEDFIIRQLYYPYRLWQGKISKKVVPVFLSYSDDVFHFFIYEFADPQDYNSITLVAQKNCVLTPERIGWEDIRILLKHVRPAPEPAEPFPQADRFDRVVDLLALLARGEADGEFITQNYDFDPRQTQYYTGAAKYLGLIEGSAGSYFPSEAGERILRLGRKAKRLALAKAILSHEVFHQACLLYLERSGPPSRDEIVSLMKASPLRGLGSDETYRRRARTVTAWVEWILRLQSGGSRDFLQTGLQL